MIVGVPDQEPGAPVRVSPTVTAPVIVGPTVFAGGAGATVEVGDDVATDEPSVFDAVTTTRTVEPTSLFASAYVLTAAPEMLLQLPPEVLQSSH